MKLISVEFIQILVYFPISNQVKQGQFVKNNSTQKISLVTAKSGQAMIEYVLLLVVSVSLVLMAKGLFTGMGKFMDGYMGKYVRCLMEHGELPAFGAQNPEINKNSGTSYVCAKQFSYSVTTGFSENGSGGLNGSGSGTGSSSSGSSKSSNNKSGNQNGEVSSASASDGTTSGSSAESIASRERRRKSNRTANSGGSNTADNSSYASGKLGTADGADDSSNAGQSRVVGELGRDGKRTESDAALRQSGRTRRYVTGISGKLAEEIEKNSKTAQTNSKLKSSGSRVISESENTLGPARSYVKRMERKVAVEEEEEKSAFSMGQFFKYILIIVLIIVIVIFFGGQLLNYSKSD
jgi:hypothetical protein